MLVFSSGAPIAIAVVAAGWATAWYFVPAPREVFIQFWHFFFLGIGGAIAANATGAGGGIVFIPAFTSLGIQPEQALGTSIAIQCFGMTAGALSWIHSLKRSPHSARSLHLLKRTVALSGSGAIIGMLSGQYLLPLPAFSVTEIFRYFSIFFGATLLLATLRKRSSRHTRYYIRRRHMPVIFVVSLLGGLVTSWISIGAGEWLALIMFFLGYPTMIGVAAAVCISSLIVLAGVGYHLAAGTIVWQVLLFAAPAAIIGGTVARFLAQRLGPTRLKVFFATWILATGLAM